MNDAIRLTRLPSGLTVVSEKMPRVETVSIGAYVHAGTRDEAAGWCDFEDPDSGRLALLMNDPALQYDVIAAETEPRPARETVAPEAPESVWPESEGSAAAGPVGAGSSGASGEAAGRRPSSGFSVGRRPPSRAARRPVRATH